MKLALSHYHHTFDVQRDDAAYRQESGITLSEKLLPNFKKNRKFFRKNRGQLFTFKPKNSRFNVFAPKPMRGKKVKKFLFFIDRSSKKNKMML